MDDEGGSVVLLIVEEEKIEKEEICFCFCIVFFVLVLVGVEFNTQAGALNGHAYLTLTRGATQATVTAILIIKCLLRNY